MKEKPSRANAAPLLSWDVFIETLQRRAHFEEDIRAIRKISRKNKWPALELSVDNALIWGNKTILITTPALEIIHATKNLAAMTGYVPEEVIGKTPRMFQGPATGAGQRAEIRAAIELQRAFEVTITNYRKDGSVYECHVEAYPIFNKKKQLTHFIAFENAA